MTNKPCVTTQKSADIVLCNFAPHILAIIKSIKYRKTRLAEHVACKEEMKFIELYFIYWQHKSYSIEGFWQIGLLIPSTSLMEIFMLRSCHTYRRWCSIHSMCVILYFRGVTYETKVHTQSLQCSWYACSKWRSWFFWHHGARNHSGWNWEKLQSLKSTFVSEINFIWLKYSKFV